MTDDELRAVVTAYDEACERAREQRDTAFRRAKDQGRSQAEIVRATGYSRETIRQALDPTIRETVNARRRKADG